MKENDENLNVEKHMSDLKKLYPAQLLISKKQLTQIRTNSESTLNREKFCGKGIPFKQEDKGIVMYPLRNVAAWLAGTPYLDKNLLLKTHIKDILEIFPGQLLVSKKQLAQLRTISESTLNREKVKNKGIAFTKEGGQIFYYVRDLAEWLCDTVKTVG